MVTSAAGATLKPTNQEFDTSDIKGHLQSKNMVVFEKCPNWGHISAIGHNPSAAGSTLKEERGKYLLARSGQVLESHTVAQHSRLLSTCPRHVHREEEHRLQQSLA